MLEKITSFITGLMVAIGGFFTPTHVQDAPIEPTPIQEESFGAFSPVAGGTYRLKTSIGTSDTTIILSSFTEPITGNPLTMTSLATDIGYATIDPQSSTRKEFVSFTGITQNADGSATLTGVSRGLGFQSPFTASSTLRKSHPGQSIFILSDSPQLFSEYARRRANETITGQWTFSTFPITPSTTPATATSSGLVELATGAEAASSTIEGDIPGYKLALHTGIATSSSPASGNVVVVTGDDGNIDTGFIPSGFNTASTTIFADAGTFAYQKNSATRYVIVEVVGGGGGGGAGFGSGSAPDDYGGGGGGGGYARELFLSAELSASTTVVVGAGGGSTASGGSSYFGGTTTVTALLYATGGTLGQAGNGSPQSAGGAGGMGFNGDVNAGGDAGGASGNDTVFSFSGEGGASVLGGGGVAMMAGETVGASGASYGGGGSGGTPTSNSNYAGGSGATGVVIITEYF